MLQRVLDRPIFFVSSRVLLSHKQVLATDSLAVCETYVVKKLEADMWAAFHYESRLRTLSNRRYCSRELYAATAARLKAKDIAAFAAPVYWQKEAKTWSPGVKFHGAYIYTSAPEMAFAEYTIWELHSITVSEFSE